MLVCVKCKHDVPEGSRFCPFCGDKIPEIEKKKDATLSGKIFVGKYKVLRPIGTGAMGSIYLAQHMALEKTICLKVLHSHLVKDESHLKRFHREARASSRLNHPNCIGIIDYGQTDDGLTFIAMEYVHGEDLARILSKEVRLQPERVLRIAIQICEALDEAHAKWVVHRDLKPENIMLEQKRLEPDFVKVLDFGIAKIRDPSGSSGSSFHTATGLVFGTPEYMSPEQVRGEELDGKSDMYSLGIVMYQMLTGELPFTGESVLEIVTQHLTAKPAPLEKLNPDLPREICDVVMGLLSKKKDERPSALELRERLQKILNEIREKAALKKESKIKDANDLFSKATEKVSLPKELLDEVISDKTLVYKTPDFGKELLKKQKLSGFKQKEVSNEHRHADSLGDEIFPETKQMKKWKRNYYLFLMAVIVILLAAVGFFVFSYLF